MTARLKQLGIRAGGEQGPKGRARRGLVRALAVSLVLVAVGPAHMAIAAGPTLTITSPTNGSTTNNQMPSFSGTTNDPFNEETEMFDAIRLDIFAGTAVGGGVPLQELTTQSLPSDGTWSLPPDNTLPEGVYTVQATQTNFALETGKSEPVTFTVDTTPPRIALTSPANGSSTSSGSQLVAGTAGTSEGDLPTVTVQLFSGPTTVPQAYLESLVVQALNGSWSAPFGGLSPGTYTARAEQSDRAGNTGTSAPVTFTVSAPVSPGPQPPAASFSWFPSGPQTGQSILLVSSSTDTRSPITAFAWAVTSSGAFQPGGPVLTTSFSTPGNHVVRLRVTDADGLSSVASETIPVTSPPLTLMQPFPIVRIAGSETSSGVHLGLLTVQAPVGALVVVACRGRGCPTTSESKVAASIRSKSKAGTVTLAFRRFERSLRAGVILEIQVSKPGEIGKYTGFRIRRGKLPVRVDACLGPTDSKPMPCPSS